MSLQRTNKRKLNSFVCGSQISSTNAIQRICKSVSESVSQCFFIQTRQVNHDSNDRRCSAPFGMGWCMTIWSFTASTPSCSLIEFIISLYFFFGARCLCARVRYGANSQMQNAVAGGAHTQLIFKVCAIFSDDEWGHHFAIIHKTPFGRFAASLLHSPTVWEFRILNCWLLSVWTVHDEWKQNNLFWFSHTYYNCPMVTAWCMKYDEWTNWSNRPFVVVEPGRIVRLPPSTTTLTYTTNS